MSLLRSSRTAPFKSRNKIYFGNLIVTPCILNKIPICVILEAFIRYTVLEKKDFCYMHNRNYSRVIRIKMKFTQLSEQIPNTKPHSNPVGSFTGETYVERLSPFVLGLWSATKTKNGHRVRKDVKGLDIWISFMHMWNLASHTGSLEKVCMLGGFH